MWLVAVGLGVLVLVIAVPMRVNAQCRTAVLTWDDNSSNEDGFVIQRKNDHCSATGSFADIGSVGASTPTFTDACSPFPYACYRVRATLSGVGDSENSEEVGTVLPARAGRRGLSRR
jgi:hypothetical protein